jgi:hypothetical protein
VGAGLAHDGVAAEDLDELAQPLTDEPAGGSSRSTAAVVSTTANQSGSRLGVVGEPVGEHGST